MTWTCSPAFVCEADDRADMIALACDGRAQHAVLVPCAADGEIVVELGDEIVAEILRHAPVIVADIADDAAILRVDLDHRAAGIAVEQDMRVVALGEGEAKLCGARGGCHFGRHVIIGQIDLVGVRMRRPRPCG